MSKNKRTSTENGDDMRAWREQARKRRQKHLKENSPKVIEWAEKNEVAWNPYSPYVIRLSKGMITVDIYPMSGKWHNITLNKRGQAKDIVQFLANTFYILLKSGI